MLVIHLWLLLLPFGVPSVVSAALNAKATCKITTAKDASDTQKCTTRDLLWGWLHVINKISVRIDEVHKNASEIAKGVVELRKEAKIALANATKFLNEFDSNHEEHHRMKEVMKNISDAITWANESERNATEAANTSNITGNFIRDGYGAISLVVHKFKGGDYVQELKYDALSTKIGEIMISKNGGCARVHNVSRDLIAYAEKLHNKETNLTEWKTEMLKTIKSTYNDTQSNATTCQSVFNNHEKVNEVMNAVGNLSEQLIVVVKHLEMSILTRDRARKNIAAANESMETATANMLNSLKQDGAELCGILRRHGAVWSELDETKQRLKETSQRARSGLTSAANIKRDAAVRSELVRVALKQVEQIPQLGGSYALNKLTSSGNATAVMENMKGARESAEHAVQLSAEVNLRTKFTEKEIESEYEKLKVVESDLRKRLSEISGKISNVKTSDCNDKLLGFFTELSVDALLYASKLNKNELLKANETLRDLEARAEEINKNVSSISRDLEVAVQNLKNVNELMRSSSVAAEAEVADVLKHLMSELCATAAELRATRKNLTLLSANATSIKKSVSEEEAQAIAASKNASGSPDMSPYVEEGFTVAVRMTVLLEKELQRTNARLEMMTASRAAMKLKEVHAGNTNVFDAVSDAVVGIFADTPGKPHENVCTRNATSELVQKLKGKSGDFPLLRDTSVITELNRFATKMSDELKGAVKRMNNVVVRAAEANEALAEAVRRAREDAAGRRCLPLHQQLFNVLSGWW
ncbi:hypothetical protein ERJ75_000077100 [Trypanosoma vivax]|nr:hypothetical protein ERJ75_000077100 [Trypanosoma vivax]